MAVDVTPWSIDGNTHPAAGARVMTSALLAGDSTVLNLGTVAFTDPSHGIASGTDFAVAQNGTPNMTVNVSNGSAFVRSGFAINQSYHVRNGTGQVSLAISAADATNARWDLVILEVRDSNFTGANDDARLVVVAGTPAASPADPSLTAYPNCLVLARITVPALDTTIGTAQITDLRRVATGVGEIRCTSSTRPPGHSGVRIWETDTLRSYRHDGSNYLLTNHGARIECRVRRTTNQSVPTASTTRIQFATEDVDTIGMSDAAGNFTVPAGLGGMWAITCRAKYSASTSTRSFIDLSVTSSVTGISGLYRFATEATWDRHALGVTLPLAAGDTFLINAYHETGSSRDIDDALLVATRTGP